jgi:parallel beta-helix repeat protein
VVHDNSDDGIDTWDCPSNTVSNNTVYHNGGTGDGNGIKAGYGGMNTVTGNTVYDNLACGFTSNGGGNYYENNTSYNNGDCGFEDDWRVSGNTQTSQFINNKAWGNPKGNFRTGQYTVTFEGNSEASPQSQTPPSTSTSTPEPAVTPTATPTGIIATATEITPTPLAETPVFTSTFTVTPPALPSGTYVLTSVDLDTLLVGQTGSVSVSLNGLPAEGIASVEFACTYASDQVSIGNVQIGQIFGDDPVSAYNNSQNGSFIYAVAASNGRVINTNGVAFTFSITGLQPGSSSVECKANISRANQPLESIASVPDSLTVTLQSAPTATPLSPPTPLPPPMLTGKVIASKPVTINLFNPDMTLAGTAKANPDGTFNLIAPAGTFTVVASAEGYLSAQGSVTLSEGATTMLDPITLPAGDIDNNSVIDQYDALTVGMNYNVSAALPADLSNDGLINVMDLEMLAENYRMAGLLSWQQP